MTKIELKTSTSSLELIAEIKSFPLEVIRVGARARKKIERNSPAICIPSNRLTGDTLYYIMHTDIDLMRLFMIETVHGELPSQGPRASYARER